MEGNTPDATIGDVERDPATHADFIRAIVAENVQRGDNGGRVATRLRKAERRAP